MNVRFIEAETEALRRQAEAEHRSMHEVTRAAVREYIAPTLPGVRGVSPHPELIARLEASSRFAGSSPTPTCGAPPGRAIAHQTRHRSLATVGTYVRVHEAWADNAATMLGP